MAKTPPPAAATGRGGRLSSTVDRVAERIRAGIKSGRFLPGHRLIEADLAREFAVSRGPIREAIGRLVAEELLSVERNRGATVRRLSREEVLDLFRVREAIEGLAARQAAERLSRAAGRQALRAVQGEIAALRRRPDLAAYRAHNERFHAAVVELSGNRELAKLVERLSLAIYYIQFRRQLDPRRIAAGLGEHERICEAIARGDGEAAERAMRQHVRRSHRSIAALADSEFGEVSPGA